VGALPPSGVTDLPTLLALARLAVGQGVCGHGAFVPPAGGRLRRYLSLQGDAISVAMYRAPNTTFQGLEPARVHDSLNNTFAAAPATLMRARKRAGGGFVDIKLTTYRFPPGALDDRAVHDDLPPGARGRFRSDVLEVEVQSAFLPDLDSCNTWPGAAGGDECQTAGGPMVIDSEDPPVNVTVTVTDPPDTGDDTTCAYLQCAFYDETAGAWGASGCSLVASADGQVTCACGHLTAFAVREVLFESQADCPGYDLLSLARWTEVYGSGAYRTFLRAMAVMWCLCCGLAVYRIYWRLRTIRKFQISVRTARGDSSSAVRSHCVRTLPTSSRHR
jgi:hypothetical protein